MSERSYESTASWFLKESALVDIPHLRANFQKLLNSVAFLGADPCEMVAKLWYGPKGIGKTALLRALCVAGKLQSLVNAKHPQYTHCQYLTAVYIDLRHAVPELAFSQVLCNGLLQYDGPLPGGFDAKLRALATEAGGLGEPRISKLNKLLSDNSVAVLCVVDEADNLYKQGTFTDDLSRIWVRELLMLTGLKKAPGTKVSIGVVMCCSHARARQLFLLDTEKVAAPQQREGIASSGQGASSTESTPHESGHSAASAAEDSTSNVPLLPPAEALQLLLAYTGGNHRAIKAFVEHFVEFLPTFDAASYSFKRDEFVEQLDSLAKEHGWDVAKALSDEDKRVVCELLALLPENSTSLDLTMHFDQDRFTVPKGALEAKLREGELDRAADSGAVFVSRASVALSSPATLFRYMDSGVDFEMLRWMLYPLGAFSERLELPVAQAIARGAKQLLPAECALSSQTTAVQVSQDSGGQTLLPFKIGVCSVDAAPHARFVADARLVNLAAKLGTTPAKSRTGKVTRKLAWEAISTRVLELVKDTSGGASGAAAEDRTTEEKAKATWVLNVLLAAPVEREHRDLLQQPNISFAVKEHPDVYGGDALFVHIALDGQMSIVRVQVKVASPSSLKQEISYPAAEKCFGNARAAVNKTISGFAGSGTATSATAATIQERNASVALFMAAVRAASRLKQAGHVPNFSSDGSAQQSVEHIIAQQATCSAVDCRAVLATTHVLRNSDRDLCKAFGIASIDCHDLYDHWGPCGALARKLRAAPFWLPKGSIRVSAGTFSAAEEGVDEFEF